MASDDDHRLALELAGDVGRALVDLRSRLLAEDVDPAHLGARSDAVAHELIVGRLTDARPGDAVLSEEATGAEHADLSRLAAERVWIVDPLDGTREFREGRSDWAVHVALVEAHVPTAGAVALPDRGVVYGTDRPLTLPPAAVAPRMVVSRTRPPIEAAAILAALGATLVEMGSAGAKAMAVLRGEVDLYVHSGGLNEWDACAPVAVALAAGLHASHLDGSPMRFNLADTDVSDLLVCRSELADATIAAAASVMRDADRTGAR